MVDSLRTNFCPLYLKGRHDHESEDVEHDRFRIPSHMPRYLRIDLDIKGKLVHLEKLMNEYAEFDIVQLDRD